MLGCSRINKSEKKKAREFCCREGGGAAALHLSIEEGGGEPAQLQEVGEGR